MKRRRLQFEDFDAVLDEVDRLRATGCAGVGNWDLAQVCDHLGFAIEGSVDGFPAKGPWWVRTFVGPRARRRLFAAGRMSSGVKIPERFTPKPGLDLNQSVDRLRRAVVLFASHRGKFDSHPFLGRLTADEWRRFHLIHSAHHLGFLVPHVSADGARTPEADRV